MSIFAGLKDEPLPGKGSWFTPGVYVININRCKEGSGFKGPYCAVECSIVEVLVPKDGSCEAGERVSWVLNMSQASSSRNLKGFLSAAMNEDNAKAIDEAMALKVFGGDGTALTGLELVASVSEVPTRSGGIYTKVSWFDVEGFKENGV